MSIFPPVRTLLGPVRLFILKSFPTCTFIPSFTFIYFGLYSFWNAWGVTFCSNWTSQPKHKHWFQWISEYPILPCTFISSCTFINFSLIGPLYVYSLLYVYLRPKSTVEPQISKIHKHIKPLWKIRYADKKTCTLAKSQILFLALAKVFTPKAVLYLIISYLDTTTSKIYRDPRKVACHNSIRFGKICSKEFSSHLKFLLWKKVKKQQNLNY